MRLVDKAAVRAGLGTACVMCDPGEPLAANDAAVAVLDRLASRPGHVLVVLRRHEEHLARLSWADYAAMQHLAWRVTRALDREFAPRRVFVAALGSAVQRATSFPHVHLHVVPLATDDRPADVFTWERGVYLFEDAAEERAMHARLAAAISAINS